MSRMTVFHHAKNEAGFVAAVIHVDDCHVFYGLGFVESVDHVEPYAPPEDTTGDPSALVNEIAQLKQQVINEQGQQAQLKQQLLESQGEINGLQQLLEQTRAQLSAARVKSDAPLTDSDGATKDQKKNSKA
ncbi:hypothetical protein [Lelliottia wanjuensis]|uniref:hypothetical protein n=1 Tax=Lelliottia wanjuensis TaxID=3050585 RepID=UPI00254ABFD3|nr:hypothetical protein [Lelliottia sp. V86_10]MDK9585419.1 hypothetical protein [Lelliottia sp. V86_10]